MSTIWLSGAAWKTRFNRRLLICVYSCAAIVSVGCQVTAPKASDHPAVVTTRPVDAGPGDAGDGDGDEGKETLRAPSPDGWRLVAQLNRGDTRLLQYAPPAASPMADDEELKLESFRVDAAMTPPAFLANIARDYQQQCPAASIHNIVSKSENGFPVQVSLFICNGANKLRPTLQMIKAIQGNEWFYVVSRGSRTATATDKFAELKPRIAAWLLYMGEISLCTVGAPEHPCSASPGAGKPNGSQAH